jgi:hypothetical protein
VHFRGVGKRVDGSRFVEVNHYIELPGEFGIEVVADALRLRTVDNTDRSFESRLRQKIHGVFRPQGKAARSGFMESIFVAIGQRGTDALRLIRPVPIRRGSHGSSVSRESDEETLPGIPSTKLADIPFTHAAHFRGPCVAQM